MMIVLPLVVAFVVLPTVVVSSPVTKDDLIQAVPTETEEYYDILRASYIEKGCMRTWGEFPTRESVTSQIEESSGADGIVLSRRGRSVQVTENVTSGMVCSCAVIHDLAISAMEEIIQAEGESNNIDFTGERSESSAGVGQSFACDDDGFASDFPCKKVDLVAYIDRQSLKIPGGNAPRDVNDVWGWTSSDGREIVIWGVREGVFFVELSAENNPIILGFLRSSGNINKLQRDVKAIGNYAYVGSESSNHGIQIFDMTKLLGPRNCVDNTYCKELNANLLYTGTPQFSVKRTHNIVVNPDSNYMYLVGGTTGCNGGLHVVDVSNPLEPKFKGCFGEDGYVHDAHCVNYKGPDINYAGKEICACFNENTVTIVDVTNKADMKMVSKSGYDMDAYTHQGWFSSDHRHIVFGDEVDEMRNGFNTRTMVVDATDLKNLKNFKAFFGRTNAIDHNQYIVKGNEHDYVFQSNYEAGLQILKAIDYDNANFEEVAYFDTTPTGNGREFKGAWSVYSYFKSGVVAISSLREGLFIVKPKLGDDAFLSPPPTSTPTKSPTSTPTKSPTSSPTISSGNSGCEDSKELKFQNKRRKGCKWVGKKRRRIRRRCKKVWQGYKLFEFCPMTCGKVGLGNCLR